MKLGRVVAHDDDRHRSASALPPEPGRIRGTGKNQDRERDQEQADTAARFGRPHRWRLDRRRNFVVSVHRYRRAARRFDLGVIEAPLRLSCWREERRRGDLRPSE
jgi:hypothetical protein